MKFVIDLTDFMVEKNIDKDPTPPIDILKHKLISSKAPYTFHVLFLLFVKNKGYNETKGNIYR